MKRFDLLVAQSFTALARGILATRVSVLEEGYLIEEGGLTKFQKCYKRGSFAYKRGVVHTQNVTRGGS